MSDLFDKLKDKMENADTAEPAETTPDDTYYEPSPTMAATATPGWFSKGSTSRKVGFWGAVATGSLTVLSAAAGLLGIGGYAGYKHLQQPNKDPETLEKRGHGHDWNTPAPTVSPTPAVTATPAATPTATPAATATPTPTPTSPATDSNSNANISSNFKQTSAPDGKTKLVQKQNGQYAVIVDTKEELKLDI